MQCPNCRTENSSRSEFCVHCGARLIWLCPQCGMALPASARFCSNCATPVSPSATASPSEARRSALNEALQRLVPKEYAERLLAAGGHVAGERRMVTILFSDVKGSTSIAEELDPEDVKEIMDGVFTFLIPPIYRYEGTLVQVLGDAILAFFGAPIAHEDDPERACRAALEIIAQAQRYAETLRVKRGIEGFNVRVGINTGLVVVGELGSDLRVAYTAVGDAINLAARMESSAEPGTILITEQTHKLIAPLFETEALGPIQVKGRAKPVAVYRVLATRGMAGKARGIAGLGSPMVGREAEFAALCQAVERLQSGLGGIVTIVGEAGLGKSRLVAEMRKTVQAQPGQEHGRTEHVVPPQWAEGRCLSYGTTIAYQLWLDMLRSLLAVTADASPTQMRDKLREQVETVCPALADDVYPYLAQLMTLPAESDAEVQQRSQSGEELKARTFHAIETMIAHAARARRLVLVCEDLHWADPTSLELLERLLPLTDRAPLLLICLCRPQSDHGSWRIRETAARLYHHRHIDLELRPLSATESEILLGNLMGTATLLNGFREHVLQHAEGNPFYVEEVLRSLIDRGAIVRDPRDGQWSLARNLDEIHIPETLQGVLMARIDRLQEESKHVLQMAAVIGRIFPYRVLAVLLEEEPHLDEHLILLQREEMIHERARLPELEYIFKHELTREAAYESLKKQQRRVLHRQVAEAVERLFAPRIEENVELLAYHWEQAADLEKASQYLIRAGDRATQLGASLEAVHLYEKALQKASQLPSPQGELALRVIHEALGDVYLVNLSQLEEALSHYEQFAKHAAAGEEAGRAARKVATVHVLRGNLAQAHRSYESALAELAPLSPRPETSRVHHGLSYLLGLQRRLDEAEHHALSSLEISRQAGDALGSADAYRMLGIIASERGDVERACGYDERSLELYRQLGDLARTAQACDNVGDTYRLLGRMDRAWERLQEGLAIARRIGDSRDEALTLQTMAELLLDQGEWRAAIAHLEEALPAAEKSGVAARRIEAERILGSAYDATGELAHARQHLESAETLVRETQQSRFAPWLYLDLAHLEATDGQFGPAVRYLQMAQQAAGAQPTQVFLGWMHRCQGYIQARQGDWDAAISSLQSSLGYLEGTHFPAEIARTRLSLGIAYRKRNQEGDGGRASEQLLAALSLFRQIQAGGYVRQVQAELQDLPRQPQSEEALPLQDAAQTARSPT
jgi:class 3 adenylate cyclase/tetratricopeptide (TPR) repeat protein